MKTLRPFADQGNYIAVHRVCFDLIMPTISGNAWKVLCFIIRKTEGYGKRTDAIAYTQIAKGTGIKSDTTIRRALMELQGFVNDGDQWTRDYSMPDYILCWDAERFKESNAYALNRDVEIYTSNNTLKTDSY